MSSPSLVDSILQSVGIEDLVREVKDYALLNGIGLRNQLSNDDDSIDTAPLTACPSPFPSEAFDYARDAQKTVNLLMHLVGHDLDFLSSALNDVIAVDDFTRHLLDVHQQATRIGSFQELSFGIFRADYMLSEKDLQVRHVETNAIAAGFAYMGSKITQMHKHIVSKYCPSEVSRLPENMGSVNLAESMSRAFDSYGNPDAIILVVTEDRTLNLCDQRGLEFELSKQRPDIRVVRRKWNDLHGLSNFTEDRKFVVEGREVALVYYRYCYDPSHYSGEESWKLRLRIETSRAIKCPSIQHHLAGVKKVQQLLVDNEMAEKFLSRGAVKLLSQTYVGLYGLEEDGRGDAAIKMAREMPHNFVLKPQREGGGNNLFGDDIVDKLTAIENTQERLGYILMDLIRCPVNKSIFVTAGSPPLVTEATSELGIFGSILGSKNSIVFNHQEGHVLRSKKVSVNEGGICGGFGLIDSPLLYPKTSQCFLEKIRPSPLFPWSS